MSLGCPTPPNEFHRTHDLKVTDTLTVTSHVVLTVLSPRESWQLVTLLPTPLGSGRTPEC